MRVCGIERCSVLLLLQVIRVAREKAQEFEQSTEEVKLFRCVCIDLLSAIILCKAVFFFLQEADHF